MNVPVNVPLMSNPVNWIIVLLMVLIASLAIGLVFSPQPTAE